MAWRNWREWGPGWGDWRRPGEWTWRNWATVSLVAVAFFVLLASARGPGPNTPRTKSVSWGPFHGQSIKNRGFEVLGFYVKGAVEPKGATEPIGSWPAFERYVSMLNVVSPFWYSAKPDGTVVGEPEPRVIDLARKHGVRVIPLVNNAKVGGGLDQRTENDRFLRNPAARARAIDQLVAIVKRHNYDGINVDFQLISPQARDGLTAFVRDLAARLHPMGKEVHVDVIPEANVPDVLHRAFDYGALGRFADRVILMTYDEHSGESTPPGPVANLPWVERNIRFALGYVPKNKLSLGVAVYGYDWPIPSSKGTVQELSAKRAEATAREVGVPIRRTRTGAIPNITYTRNGVTRSAWWEDATSARKKVDLAQKYDLRGISVWRLGFEDRGFWKMIEEKTGRPLR
ncbi:MAG: hypothetical protein IMW99_07050 [Firmicutes bacterium]|nr:hypothetical protein [Bacillota bacterium]